MNVTVVGAGNLGLAIAAYIALNKKNTVRIYTTKKIPSHINLVDEEAGCKEVVDDYKVTSLPEEAFCSNCIVICTYPAFLRKRFIEENERFLLGIKALYFVPGYGGAEYICKKLIDNGVCIVGLQRVPYVARHIIQNKEVFAYIISKKNKLYLASIPSSEALEVGILLQNLLDINVQLLHEYLAVTFAPSNPLLHLVGLYNLFHDYKPGMHYNEELHFYEEWNDDASEMLLLYDEEVQQICCKMKPFHMKEVIPLREYYEAETKEKMTQKLKSIEAFKCVMAPMKKEKDGLVPDFSSRMFVEDFPYGICIFKAFAIMHNVLTPVIDKLLKFYDDMTGIKYFNEDGSLTEEAINTGIPFVAGVKTMEDLVDIYK